LRSRRQIIEKFHDGAATSAEYLWRFFGINAGRNISDYAHGEYGGI